jgi:uncharacterized glyoxalase superfamily protein PhnB
MNTSQTPKTVWPCLTYRDAHAAIEFLTKAFGFGGTEVHEGGPEKPIAHAEMRWPEGGGIMLGSASANGSEFDRRPTGASSIYVVTDEPDALFERATGAGASVIRGLRDEDYGSRGFTVSDPEGNLWSFGTYRGA